MNSRIVRVFPRRTSATPTDDLAFVGDPPKTLILPRSVSEVHVSVAFTWDIDEGNRLYARWSELGAPVKIGGPAFDDHGSEFIPGRYLKPGYVITSRGCPNTCWFCLTPRREGGIRELPISSGWNVLDSNLLACSMEHQNRVYDMLERQPRRPEFTGGLEAARITLLTAQRLKSIRTNRIYCAYDEPRDLPSLQNAGSILQFVGFTRSHHLHCYVLCGYDNDTIGKAEIRCREAWAAGFMPMAMLFNRRPSDEWRQFQRLWARPAITRKILGYDWL